MDALSEERIYQAFGLEPGSEEPEEETAEEPAEETAEEPEESAGENEQPAAEAENHEAEEEEPEEQSPQERHENAARRRQAEQQAAIDKAVESALKAEREKNSKDMENFFQRAGLKNTISGSAINNMEEFESWQQEFSQQKLERDLSAGRLSPESLQTAISQHPLMKQAQELISKNEEETKRQEEEVSKAQIENEIAEIGKLDPSIKSIDDLLAMDNAPEFYDAVNRGNSFIDAFKLVNFEKLSKRTAEAAKQQAMNNARSKDHLSAGARSQGEGAVTVPKAELALYRKLMPGASDADIQKHYQKYKK